MSCLSKKGGEGRICIHSWDSPSDMIKKWLTPALLLLLLVGMAYYYVHTERPLKPVQQLMTGQPTKKSSDHSDGYLVSPTSKTGYKLKNINMLQRKEWKSRFAPTAPAGYTLSGEDVVVTFKEKKRKTIDQYRLLYKGDAGTFSLETVEEVSKKKANEENHVFYNSKEHILSFTQGGHAYIIRLSDGAQYETVRTWLSKNGI